MATALPMGVSENEIQDLELFEKRHLSFMSTKSQPDGGSVQCWVRIKGWKQSLGPVFFSAWHLVRSGLTWYA